MLGWCRQKCIKTRQTVSFVLSVMFNIGAGAPVLVLQYVKKPDRSTDGKSIKSHIFHDGEALRLPCSCREICSFTVRVGNPDLAQSRSMPYSPGAMLNIVLDFCNANSYIWSFWGL